jgi:hypothetical protein
MIILSTTRRTLGVMSLSFGWMATGMAVAEARADVEDEAEGVPRTGLTSILSCGENCRR